MSENESNPTIAILAGGRSRRMGQDKASIVVDERAMIARVAAIAKGTGLPCIVVGRDERANWQLDLPFVEDQHPGLGPMAGLHAALHATSTDVLLLSCDLPTLAAGALTWLLENAAEASSGLAASRERPEPLFAVYRRDIIDEVDRRITAEELSMQSLIRSTEMRVAPLPGAFLESLDDVDTPEQLQSLRNG